VGGVRSREVGRVRRVGDGGADAWGGEREEGVMEEECNGFGG